MFGIGMPELLVILVVALVVLGPRRLPELARTLGKAMAEFRRQTSDIVDEFQVQAMLEDEKVRRKPAAANAASMASGTSTPAAAPSATTAPVPPGAEKPDAGRA